MLFSFYLKVPDPWPSCELLWRQRGAAWGQDVWSERPQWDLRCLLLCWEDDRCVGMNSATSIPVVYCASSDKPILSAAGRVFYTAAAEKFSFPEAVEACSKQGARLATTGQLYLAWQGGMDVCNAGWLGDRSVRYPINVRRPQCGGGLLGVRTVYLHTNQTGYPFPESRYDCFCYTGTTWRMETIESSTCVKMTGWPSAGTSVDDDAPLMNKRSSSSADAWSKVYNTS